MRWALFDFYVYKFVLHRSLIKQILNPFNFGIGEIFVFQNRLPAINDAGGLYGFTIFVLAISAKNCAASCDSAYHLFRELATLYCISFLRRVNVTMIKGIWRHPVLLIAVHGSGFEANTEKVLVFL